MAAAAAAKPPKEGRKRSAEGESSAIIASFQRTIGSGLTAGFVGGGLLHDVTTRPGTSGTDDVVSERGISPLSRTNGGVVLLSIKLTRMGAKKKPFYRIVVAEKRSKRDGRYIESVGHHDPRDEANFKLDRERLKYWIERGAQPTDTVRSLMKRAVKTTPAEPAA